MSDQCKHCTVRGDWDKCQSTKCFHHENWAWLQLKDQRNKLQAIVNELEKREQSLIDDVEIHIDERDNLQARVQELEEIKAIRDHIESKLHRPWLYELAVSLGYEEAKSDD